MSVEERLTHLERENRRLKIAGLLAIMLVASVFVMGQVRPSRVLEAEAFVLRDSNRGQLGAISTTLACPQWANECGTESSGLGLAGGSECDRLGR